MDTVFLLTVRTNLSEKSEVKSSDTCTDVALYVLHLVDDSHCALLLRVAFLLLDLLLGSF